MDGIISAPICIAGFFLLPDLPENTRAFYLSEDVGVCPRAARIEPNVDQDRSLAKKRMEAVGRAPRQKLTLATIRRIFSKNEIRVFVPIRFLTFQRLLARLPPNCLVHHLYQHWTLRQRQPLLTLAEV